MKMSMTVDELLVSGATKCDMETSVMVKMGAKMAGLHSPSLLLVTSSTLFTHW